MFVFDTVFWPMPPFSLLVQPCWPRCHSCVSELCQCSCVRSAYTFSHNALLKLCNLALVFYLIAVFRPSVCLLCSFHLVARPREFTAGKKPEGSLALPSINLYPGAPWEEAQRAGNNWHLPVRIW